MSHPLVIELREDAKYPDETTPSYLLVHAADEIERQARDIERLREQYGRDSLELAKQCIARDEARRNVVELREDLQEARSALAALRKRVEEAPAVRSESLACLVGATTVNDLAGKRVALVVLES